MTDLEHSPNSRQSNRVIWLALGGCLVAFLCLALTAVIGIVGYIYYVDLSPAPQPAVAITSEPRATRGAESAVVVEPPPTPLPPDNTATPPATIVIPPTEMSDVFPPEEIDRRPVPARAWDDLTTLYETNYPSHDYFEAKNRLANASLGPRTITGPRFALGDTHTFYNGDDTIEAQLLAVTDHAYFWVETSLNLDATAVAAAADRFENDYYRPTIALFGDVWSPGVDGDPRFSVLHVSNGTDSELGRFDSDNQFPSTLYSTSNEQELVYMNMGELSLGSDLYFGTLVHELQHLIQWYVDPSEALWVNEGLSQLAEISVGLETADTIDYLLNPDTRLNGWEYDEDAVYAHYAASYMFMVYLWEQLGDTAVQEFSRHPANGMAGVRAILQGYRPDATFEQFMADWAAATYLDDSAAGSRYFYRSLDFLRPSFVAEIDEKEFETVDELEQFAVDYIDLSDMRGQVEIEFGGDTIAELTDGNPPSGEQMWFAPAVDEMNARLTAAFDLRELDEANLHYAIWYDLETGYDYAYISISEDGGSTWKVIAPEDGVDNHYDLTLAYGIGYNGRSSDVTGNENGWVKQEISLDTYVGKTVQIRFDVFTDSDITARGFAIDDIHIPEMGYSTDVEQPPTFWQAEGFVQVGWQLPQQWSVQLIVDGPEPTVTPLPLINNAGRLTVDVGEGGGVLVIMPMTPFINESATYWLRVAAIK